MIKFIYYLSKIKFFFIQNYIMIKKLSNLKFVDVISYFDSSTMLMNWKIFKKILYLRVTVEIQDFYFQ